MSQLFKNFQTTNEFISHLKNEIPYGNKYMTSVERYYEIKNIQTKIL